MPYPSLFPPPQGHDPGGKVRLRLPPGVGSRAIYGGPDDCYRYSLERRWDEAAPRRAVLWVMMNPSVATETVNDPTVAKVTKFSKQWGFNTLLVGNTFAFRATDQRRLLDVADPVGPENDAALAAMAQSAELVVMAYGRPVTVGLRARGLAVTANLRALGIRPHVLRLSGTGTPVHPLYLRDDTIPAPWVPAESRLAGR